MDAEDNERRRDASPFSPRVGTPSTARSYEPSMTTPGYGADLRQPAWMTQPVTGASSGGIDYSQAFGLDPPLHPGAFDTPSTTAAPGPPYGYYSSSAYAMRRSPSRESLNTSGDIANYTGGINPASSSGFRPFQEEPHQGSPSHMPPCDSRPLSNDTPASRGDTPVHGFRPVTPARTATAPLLSKVEAPLDPAAGVAVGFASLVAENLLSHPCNVLRRQCQVHHRSRNYHLSPFALIKVVMNLQRYQGISTFWKGIGSTFIVKGMFLVSEHVITELTPFRREISLDSATVKQIMGHVTLKAASFAVITPFFSAALVESVQSDIASDRPGIFDCLREGSYRLLGYGMPQTTRLFPVWHLLLPTAVYGTLHYVITSVTQWFVGSLMKRPFSDSVLSPVPRYPDASEASSAQSMTVMVESFYKEVVTAFWGHLLADAMLYPLETVLHRLHLQGTRTIVDDLDSGLSVLPITTRYEGVFDCYRCIVREEGRMGLFKGFGALLIQYTIHFAIIKITKLLLDQIAELNKADSGRPRR